MKIKMLVAAMVLVTGQASAEVDIYLEGGCKMTKETYNNGCPNKKAREPFSIIEWLSSPKSSDIEVTPYEELEYELEELKREVDKLKREQ